MTWVYNITQLPKQKNEGFHYRNFGKIQEFSLTIFLCWIVDRIETTNRLAGDLQGTSWHLLFFASAVNGVAVTELIPNTLQGAPVES